MSAVRTVVPGQLTCGTTQGPGNAAAPLRFIAVGEAER
ncbi:hypothetical protein DFR68_106300 [Nocardia mexicana]|uniref:Uncharacterized protein n=1 Tax=Nocardia mexicana TaxID=279262 RepID=A0A370H1M7_9NOCA|nr:hypothetical protein DFR68_106300 [Nocardia mexicana]